MSFTSIWDIWASEERGLWSLFKLQKMLPSSAFKQTNLSAKDTSVFPYGDRRLVRYPLDFSFIRQSIPQTAAANSSERGGGKKRAARLICLVKHAQIREHEGKLL